MKLWIDDVRLAPEGYIRYKTVNDAKIAISFYEKWNKSIELIDTIISNL